MKTPTDSEINEKGMEAWGICETQAAHKPKRASIMDAPADFDALAFLAELRALGVTTFRDEADTLKFQPAPGRPISEAQKQTIRANRPLP